MMKLFEDTSFAFPHLIRLHYHTSYLYFIKNELARIVHYITGGIFLYLRVSGRCRFAQS